MSGFLQRFGSGSARLASKAGVSVKTYFTNLYNDYSFVMKEAALDIRAKPWKGFAAAGTIGTICYAIKTNPDDKSFMENLIEDRLRLSQVSDTVRNESSTEYIQQMADYANRGLIRRTNLILFSLIWKAEYNEKCDVYAAHCKSVKPKWREFPQKILDVGAFNRWYKLNRAMIDYDINMNEFPIK